MEISNHLDSIHSLSNPQPLEPMTVYDTCKIYFSAASLSSLWALKKKKNKHILIIFRLAQLPFCPLCLPVLLLLSKNLNVAL